MQTLLPLTHPRRAWVTYNQDIPRLGRPAPNAIGRVSTSFYPYTAATPTRFSE
jgi:hypothetical protein